MRIIQRVLFLSLSCPLITVSAFSMKSQPQQPVVDSSGDGSNLPEISHRYPTADEIPLCYEIESASYPSDEAATLEGLRYRQSNAGDYFRIATLDDTIIGFVCGTRCDYFEEESMSTHTETGPYLAIHSVVVGERYRRQGIATAMLQEYLNTIKNQQQSGKTPPIRSIVLLAKAHLLGFYVNCGFQVNRPSYIVHGKELWYELEQELRPVRNLPDEGESWFCKTEQFKQPFPVVKPHLEAHKVWVEELRTRKENPLCITSGYRVDSEGRPGGGGLMFLAAKNYEEALAIVLEDPLVANDCVDWELNGWIGQVGNIEMR